jgi:hypothetical protein
MSTVLEITLGSFFETDGLTAIRQFIEKYKIPTYQFTSVSDTDTAPYTVFRQPTLNESGAVAFEGFFAAAAPPGAIFTQDGSAIAKVADRSQGGFDITFGASINRYGNVSFTGNVFGESLEAPLASSGVYVGNGEFLATLASRSSQVEGFGNFAFFGPSALNDRLDTIEVAFIGINEQADTGVFLSQGGHITTLASSLDEFDSFVKQLPTIGGDGPFTIYAPPSLDDRATAYFVASLDNGDRGIFSSNGTTVQTLVDSQFEFDRFSAPSINDQGSVAFLSQLDDGSSGIFIRDYDGGIETVATTDGIFSEFRSDPSLNNKGKVAFQATLDSGVEGIFVGDDPVLDKVIAVGDSLGGSTVSRLLFAGRDAFNSSGQLSFGAVLADGSERLFRADPFITGYRVSC